MSISTTCAQCRQDFKAGDKVIDLRVVTGTVAPGDPNAYITTDRTTPAEYVHFHCPVGVE